MHMCICINECQNLIDFFLIVCFNDFKQRVQKETCFEKSWLVTKVMKQKSDRQLNVIFCSSAYFFSKHFVLLIIWWCHIMRPIDSHYKSSFLKLIYYQIWTFLDYFEGIDLVQQILNRLFWLFRPSFFYKKYHNQMGVHLWNAP